MPTTALKIIFRIDAAKCEVDTDILIHLSFVRVI